MKKSSCLRPQGLEPSIHQVDLYQVCGNYAPVTIFGPAPGSYAYIKSTFFSEYGHVAYQIKGNEAYINMLANILSLHTPLTTGVVSEGQFISFPKVVVLHIRLMGIKQITQCMQIFCPFMPPRSLDEAKSFWVFSEEGHVAYQIKRK